MPGPAATPAYRALARCARDSRLPFDGEGFAAEMAAEPSDGWSALPELARRHGLGPLAYRHLRSAAISVPRFVERELAGMYVACRHDNAVRLDALAEASGALARAGIPVLVLKGAALASLAYSEPALRPMSDVDLLVEPADVAAARDILQVLGYRPSAPASAPRAAHHAVPLVRVDRGTAIGFELHHRLTPGRLLHPAAPDPWAGPAGFAVGATGALARAPGHESMAWHLCHHLRGHMSVFGHHRLIWLADIVSYAERYADGIDWPGLRSRRPEVIRMLATLHHVTPLSEGLLRTAGIHADGVPGGAGLDFEGWPRRAIAAQRDKGWKGIARDTLVPSEWWMRMHYGLGGTKSLQWHRWCVHPWRILGHGCDWLAGRAGRGRNPAEGESA